MGFRKLVKLFLLFVTIAILNNCSDDCDNDNKNYVSTLYSRAITDPSGFINSVSNNPFLSQPDHGFQKCLQNFSVALLEASISGPSFDEIHSQALDIGTRVGATPDMINQVETDMQATATDLYTLSRQMSLLSKIIMDIGDGNTSTYYNSEFYLVASVLDYPYADVSYRKKVKDLMAQLSFWMVRNFLDAT